MNAESIFDLRQRLSSSLEELKMSVMSAYDQFFVKYGTGHPYITRLESYFPIIQKQEELILFLDEKIKHKDFQAVADIAAKIKGLSEMVKEDARALLYSINTGEAHTIQDIDMH